MTNIKTSHCCILGALFNFAMKTIKHDQVHRCIPQDRGLELILTNTTDLICLTVLPALLRVKWFSAFTVVSNSQEAKTAGQDSGSGCVFRIKIRR